MKKIIFLIFLFSLFCFGATNAYAACNINFSNNDPKLLDVVRLTIRGLTSGGNLRYALTNNENILFCGRTADSNGEIAENVSIDKVFNEFKVFTSQPSQAGFCTPTFNLLCSRTLIVKNATCKLSVSGNSPNITINIEQLPSLQSGVGIMWLVQQTDGSHLRGNCINGPYNPPIAVPIGQLGDDTFIFSVRYREQGLGHPLCSPSQTVLCQGTIVVRGGEPEITINPPQPAKPTIDPTCPLGDNKKGIRTALGCIPANDLNDFVGWLLRNVIFVASGIGFLLMAFGALQIITSAGSPEKMKAGSELITSALSGLLLIILSLFLLKLIGVDILQIPGFGS